MLDYLILYFIWPVWTLISAILLWRLGIFSRRPLTIAPPRANQLSGGHIVMALALYMGVGIIALGTIGKPPAKPPLILPTTIAASQPATTNTPTILATRPATTTAATESATDPDAFIRLQICDILGKIAAILFILAVVQQNLRDGINGFGFDVRKLAPGFFYGLLATFLLAPWMLALNLLLTMIGHLFRHNPIPHPILKMLGTHPPLTAQIVLIISAIVIAPLAEELFFRGLIQTTLLSLSRRRNRLDQTTTPVTPAWRWTVILIVSFIFTSIHIHWPALFSGDWAQFNWEHFPPLFLLATTLGYVYERTGNLWAAITLHGLFNLTSTVMYLLGNS